MADVLTNAEKIDIANAHKKNIELNKWNLVLSKIEENAVSSPNEQVVSALDLQIADQNARLAAIDSEIASLTE
jgi:hypothetical protein